MSERLELAGSEGRISVRAWLRDDPDRIVVIAHGFGEHSGRYEHVAAALVDRGAVVYAPDHIGHGESEGERVLIADFDHAVDDLHAVIELARGRDPELPVVLLAHSLGGMIGIRFAQRHGDELAGLIVSAPTVGLTAALAEALKAPEVPLGPVDPDALSRDPAVGEAYAADPLVWHGGWNRPTLEAFHRANAAVDAGPGFGELPALYVHGEADPLVPLVLTQPVVQRLAGGDFTERVVPDARHEALNETDKDGTIALVADFAERVTAAAAPSA